MLPRHFRQNVAARDPPPQLQILSLSVENQNPQLPIAICDVSAEHDTLPTNKIKRVHARHAIDNHVLL